MEDCKGSRLSSELEKISIPKHVPSSYGYSQKSEWWNGELVIEEHIQTRSNPKGGRWVCGNTASVWDLSHLELHLHGVLAGSLMNTY